MCTVGRIPKNDYVILLSIFEEVETVVRAVAIHEDNAGTSSCLVFSLCIKVLNQPFVTQLAVSPPIWRVCQSTNPLSSFNPVAERCVLTKPLLHCHLPISS